MALWSNTASGWGSDPSSSGNGALASYLQSSAATAPKLQSKAQVQDPSNSAPTTSIARTVQPAQTSNLVSSVITQPVTSAPTTTAVPARVSRVTADIATRPVFSAPVAVAAPSYEGPQTVAYVSTTDSEIRTSYYSINPATGGYQYLGFKSTRPDGSGSVVYAQPGSGQTEASLQTLQPNATTNMAKGQTVGNPASFLNTVNTDYKSSLDTYNAGVADARSQNQANLQAASDQSTQAYYYQYLVSHRGQLPPSTGAQQLDGGAADNKLRQAALDEYNANEASASAIRRGVAPVDTSTQDAINSASLSALASRYSTNLFGNNIGAMGRLYADAVTDQTGVNKQLSDEDYANRFNQNLAVFTQAVQNQATVDASATGTKLQSDIQAVSDTVDRLNQQVTQLGTASGLKVSNQLTDLQNQINKYNEAVQEFGAASSKAMGWAKLILGAAAAVTAIVLAVPTGGASVAAGVAAGAALSKA